MFFSLEIFCEKHFWRQNIKNVTPDRVKKVNRNIFLLQKESYITVLDMKQTNKKHL